MQQPKIKSHPSRSILICISLHYDIKSKIRSSRKTFILLTIEEESKNVEHKREKERERERASVHRLKEDNLRREGCSLGAVGRSQEGVVICPIPCTNKVRDGN